MNDMDIFEGGLTNCQRCVSSWVEARKSGLLERLASSFPARLNEGKIHKALAHIMDDTGITFGKVTNRLTEPGDYVVFTGVKKRGQIADHVLVANVREGQAPRFFDPQIGKVVDMSPGESWVAYPVRYPSKTAAD